MKGCPTAAFSERSCKCLRNIILLALLSAFLTKSCNFFLYAGEEPNSYGYGGTGRFSTNSRFQIYGERFEKGDVITACVNFEVMPPQIIYCKNGKWLGPALKLHGYQVGQHEAALFPHILLKNVRFVCTSSHRPVSLV